MSVDTYMKGKKLEGYRRRRLATDEGPVEILISPGVAAWSRLEIYTKRGLTGPRLRALLERDC